MCNCGIVTPKNNRCSECNKIYMKEYFLKNKEKLKDLTNKEEFLKACHYTNLRPLWFDEHSIKSVSERWSNK